MGQSPSCTPCREDEGKRCGHEVRYGQACFAEDTDMDPTPRCTNSARRSTAIRPVCLEPDHVRELEVSLPAELHKHLLSKEFADQCDEAFRRADTDNSGFLELKHNSGEVGAIVHELLPDLFLDRLEGASCESCARCFDADSDGKLSCEEFAGFVRWSAAMKARGFLHGQAPFATVGGGGGERLLVISEYLDEDGTLAKSVKAGVDIAVYNPSGITHTEFAQQLRAAKEKRRERGIGPYKTVGLANHGPDTQGTWSPFMGAPRDLTVAGDVEMLTPAFLALADLLPRANAAEGERGRMDLLACELGGTPGGMAFIEKLERETSHTVCASVDATGNTAHGGNWVLEVGDVNVAPDYFDEVKLQQFERLMMGHGAAARRHSQKKGNNKGNKSGLLVNNKHATDESSSDEEGSRRSFTEE